MSIKLKFRNRLYFIKIDIDKEKNDNINDFQRQIYDRIGDENAHYGLAWRGKSTTTSQLLYELSFVVRFGK